MAGASLKLIVGAPSVVFKAPVYSGLDLVDGLIHHIHGGGYHLDALSGTTTDRNVDNFLQGTAAAVHNLDRTDRLVMLVRIYVVISIVPLTGTQLATDPLLPAFVDITVVAPSIGGLPLGNDGKVIAVTDYPVDIHNLLTGDPVSVHI